jgi:hypothetical protein
MITKMKNLLLALLFVATTGGAALTVAMPQTTLAVCNQRLLTLPTWYNGLVENETTCTLKAPTDANGGLSSYIWVIALNITEMILQIVAYIAVAFIIVGGFKYITSAGSPDGMVKARKTITNAVVGLLISIFSVAIVNVISGALK